MKTINEINVKINIMMTLINPLSIEQKLYRLSYNYLLIVIWKKNA